MQCAIDSGVAGLELLNSRAVRIGDLQRLVSIERAQVMHFGSESGETLCQFAHVCLVEDQDHVRLFDRCGVENYGMVRGKIDAECCSSLNRRVRRAAVGSRMAPR